MDSSFVLRARRLIDGSGKDPIDNPVVVVKDSQIVEVGTEGNVDIPQGEDVKEITLENETILPGLIDSHIHLCNGSGTWRSQIATGAILTPEEKTFRSYPYHQGVSRWKDPRELDTDGIRLIAATIIAREALHAGITTIKDAGGYHEVPWDLREAWKMGLIETPRILISGWQLCVTGGHGWPKGDCEADGVDGVRKKVRQFVKEDVDVIKISASGGGATARSNNLQVSFSEDELRAIVEEAHKFGRTTFAHCEAYDSIGNAARAGVDVLEHCGFLLPDRTRGFDEEAVKTMAEKKLFYNPTIQTGSQVLDSLKAKKERGETLTQREERSLERSAYKIRRKQENLVRMVKMGVQIVIGSDSSYIGSGGRLLRAMEIMVDAGLTPMQVIVAATSNGAKAMNMDHLFGTIKAGLKADIIAVEGNPSKKISDLRSLKMIMQEGKIVPLN